MPMRRPMVVWKPPKKDALFDVIGGHFTGKPWPREGGIDATRRFMVDAM
jgi:hypothetical protein